MVKVKEFDLLKEGDFVVQFVGIYIGVFGFIDLVKVSIVGNEVEVILI